MQKVLAYRHSQRVNGENVTKEEVEIVDSKTEDGVTTYTVKTQDGVTCSAIFNVFNNAYYADDVYGVISKEQQDDEISYKEKLAKSADENYRRFQEKTMMKSKKEVYDDAFRINAYKTLHEFLTGIYPLEEDICKYILGDGIDVIDSLYNQINNCSASFGSWGDIEEFILDEHSSSQSSSELEM